MTSRLSINRLALLFVLALSIPLAAHADEASHRAKAQEMMKFLKTEQVVQQISDNIRKQVSDAANSIVGPDPTPEKKVKLDDFVKQASLLIDAQLGWKSMEAGFTDVYLKTFTEEEMEGILTFYKSPAGIALLEKMPKVNDQVTQLGQSRMTTLQPQLRQLFVDFQKSQAPAPPTLSPAPAAPAIKSPAPTSTPPPSTQK
jgi:uncharacterized protein